MRVRSLIKGLKESMEGIKIKMRGRTILYGYGQSFGGADGSSREDWCGFG